MLAALDNPDPEARVDAVFWIDLEGEALEQLFSMLESDPDAEVRASIVERLGDEESPATTAAVTAALRDRDSEVVLRAIEKNPRPYPCRTRSCGSCQMAFFVLR